MMMITFSSIFYIPFFIFNIDMSLYNNNYISVWRDITHSFSFSITLLHTLLSVKYMFIHFLSAIIVYSLP